MVEALDDCTIFAIFLPFLHTLVLSAKRFRAASAYASGWLASWPNRLRPSSSSAPSIATMPSVDPENMLSEKVVLRDVNVISYNMEFLRVAS
jgi:hypothetical protein